MLEKGVSYCWNLDLSFQWRPTDHPAAHKEGVPRLTWFEESVLSNRDVGSVIRRSHGSALDMTWSHMPAIDSGFVSASQDPQPL
jgi:hypothetical protein